MAIKHSWVQANWIPRAIIYCHLIQIDLAWCAISDSNRVVSSTEHVPTYITSNHQMFPLPGLTLGICKQTKQIIIRTLHSEYSNKERSHDDKLKIIPLSFNFIVLGLPYFWPQNSDRDSIVIVLSGTQPCYLESLLVHPVHIP